MEQNTYLEIASDAATGSKVYFNRHDHSHFVAGPSQRHHLATVKKIEKELLAARTRSLTSLELLALHRRIRAMLGNPGTGLALYPKPAHDKSGFNPVLDRNQFDFGELRRTTLRNQPNIVVKVAAAGICQSDRRVMRGTKPANFSMEQLVLGHEGGGYILDPGHCSDLYQVGQKVVLLPHLTCSKASCPSCSTFRPNLCKNLRHMGFHINGNMATLMAFPEQCVMAVPDSLPEDLLPLVEPLACVTRGLFHAREALSALNSRHAYYNNPFTIYGCGPIGCLAAMACRHFFGNINIQIIDPSEERIRSAQHLQIANSYASAPAIGHEVAFIANSFFASIEAALSKTNDEGTIVLFSGINTDQFETADREQLAKITAFEDIHRQEAVKSIEVGGRRIHLVGSSGYTYYDIRRAIGLLLGNQDLFPRVQNAIIEGLDGKTIQFHSPNPRKVDIGT
ncbi:alcohol dehydrogenase catalytic domain-containing protein, partial [Silvimonas sp.]|uniref:alcohol dehydrogenase catalytic domain-containing protein n=1 Tax=Silvimonas sp. TaxID=2650811 RepID=UPI0028454077